MTSPDAPAYLRVRKLEKQFGDFTALRDISLDVYEGEFVCFLGPSGCGKTTLLRAIAGLDIQTAGTIEQAGRDISALPPAERDFGIVFQSYALFPNLTVNRNVGYGLENKGQPKAEIAKRVTELLALVGLADQGDKYPAQLSGGQQQRVALARALATAPGLLLLDEPLSALDAKVRAHLRHEIKDLQDKIGVTTIMVTHDQEEALTMADRIVVMNHGIIDQIGTPNEIYSEPASPFVADFIGTMNFIDGEVVAGGRVSVGGIEIELTEETAAYHPGDKVKVCIRPEDIAVVGDDEPADDVAELPIREVEFLGSFHRAHFQLPGEAILRADLSAHRARRLNIGTGGTFKVALQREFIRLYPAGDDG